MPLQNASSRLTLVLCPPITIERFTTGDFIVHPSLLGGSLGRSLRIDAKRHLTSQGVFSGGKGPYGFDIIKDSDFQRMVPNATEQAVIEHMKAMRVAGATYREIGSEVSMQARSVQRILERIKG